MVTELVFLGYWVFVSVFATSIDIKNAAGLERTELSHEAEMCANKYFANHCDEAEARRLPLLDEKCYEWELCMKKKVEEVRGFNSSKCSIRK